MNKFMELAIAEAEKGLKKNEGGPFGAVIVRNGKVISKGHNMVVRSKDPTSHAEVVAIRAASKKLKKFDLSDCEMYTVCEPCPMCLSAVMWARIGKVYFGCSRRDAAKIGFDDEHFYDVIRGKVKKNGVKLVQVGKAGCGKVFSEWVEKEDKVRY